MKAKSNWTGWFDNNYLPNVHIHGRHFQNNEWTKTASSSFDRNIFESCDKILIYQKIIDSYIKIIHVSNFHISMT